MKEKIIASFSGGKDSTYMLHKLLQENKYEIVSLLTTVTTKDETSGHMVDYKLIESQAAAIGLPLYKIQYPLYDGKGFEKGMIEAMEHFRKEGVTKIAFGDLFLEECIAYKQHLVESNGYELILPLAGIDTKQLVMEFIELGYKGKIVSIRMDKLDSSFLGRDLDKSFIEALPEDTDPCGEFGEYHTFVYDGPIFSHPIYIELEDERQGIPSNALFSEIGYKRAVKREWIDR
ncbi:diphthine--ammonia ligase [Bacillus sp. 165]|uniref:Dph6-related ATP pyrophosphatase n=1 Tax=Bacillus sp. 165 TaxID=1529117 RepID=UPI001ADAF434|nr:diphthine--ammonia ligase [Bacillus sp. 165]MBO9128992.1 diphthine--ammonia ligase [Bacillus sp. 165]